ncbi:DUF4365 domain-containing protein [Streptomyces sp. NPDC002138]|uniref:DUF4365 domain-containing protein n=1 Tax=Streptomyces sp. NPDC002138 TaxID=3154410 RepID=UPI0033322076
MTALVVLTYSDQQGGGPPMTDVVDASDAERKKPRQRHIDAVAQQTVTDMMEQLQQGYMASIAATAGCTFEMVSKDAWGIDAQIIRPPNTATQVESMLFAQLKCTTQITPDPEREFFSYQFTKRQYFDHLAKFRSYPKAILVVMTVPTRQLDWTEVGHQGLLTRRSCYWVHLENVESATHVAKPSVRIPTKNIFDANALINILDRTDRGESING